MNCPFKQTFRILLKSVILLVEKELTAACHTTATFFFSFLLIIWMSSKRHFLSEALEHTQWIGPNTVYASLSLSIDCA